MLTHVSPLFFILVAQEQCLLSFLFLATAHIYTLEKSYSKTSKQNNNKHKKVSVFELQHNKPLVFIYSHLTRLNPGLFS